MKKGLQTSILVLFSLITVAISIEYKYPHVFRRFSQRILPSNSVLPKWFEQKIIFHPSDWIAPLLLGVVLLGMKGAFQRGLQRGALLAVSFPLFAALSIAVSPLSGYPVLYWHLWQLLTPILLFCAAVCLEDATRKSVVRAVFFTIAWMGLFQALVALGQYFGQESLGLRWLGESSFHRLSSKISSFITVPEGRLWVVDRWLGSMAPTETVVRASGTLAHPNVLGGFLMMSSLITLFLFSQEKRKWLWGTVLGLQLIAMTLSFSRAAFFAFVIGFGIWLFYQIRQQKETWKPALWAVGCSFALIGFLFHEQIFYRGGMVNYNQTAQNSDSERFLYQKIALEMIQKHPGLGVGHQQFTYRIPEFVAPEKKDIFLPSATHNIYLLWAAETGLVSLACYLILIGYVVWIGLRSKMEPSVPCLLGIFGGFLFIGFCDFYLLLFQSGRLMFFLIAGLIAAHRPLYRISTSPVPDQ